MNGILVVRSQTTLPAALGVVLALSAFLPAEAQTTTRASISSGGAQSNGDSYSPHISRDGKFVAFSSLATDLVTGGTNGQEHIFVRDYENSGPTRLASVGSGGDQADGRCTRPSVSDEGRSVAFRSEATNLLGTDGDTNGLSDIFVRDLDNGSTTRVSVGPGGAEADGVSNLASISGDGTLVAFASDATNLLGPGNDVNGARDCFVHDLENGVTSLVSANAPAGVPGNGRSNSPVVSGNGRHVVFQSRATDLITGGTNGNRHIFIRDLETGETRLVSVDSSGTQANDDCSLPSISSTGRYVTFASMATNLVSGGGNGRQQVYVHDTVSGTTTRASVDSDGNEGEGDERPLPNSELGVHSSISSDGNTVVFWSRAADLVDNDTNTKADVFVHDRTTAVTSRASLTTDGDQADGESFRPSITADGMLIAFRTDATNLLGPGGDTNDSNDIYVRDLTVVEEEDDPPVVPPPPTGGSTGDGTDVGVAGEDGTVDVGNDTVNVSADGLQEGTVVALNTDEIGDTILAVADPDGESLLTLEVGGVPMGSDISLSVDEDGNQQIVLTDASGAQVTLELNSLPVGSTVRYDTADDGSVTFMVTDASGEVVDVVIDYSQSGDDVTLTVTYNEDPDAPQTARIVSGFPGFENQETLGGSVTIDEMGLAAGEVVTVSLVYDEEDLTNIAEGELRVLRLNENTGVYVPPGNNDVGVSEPTGMLGDYGVDTTNNQAWAEVDLLGTFAVGVPASEPEPTPTPTPSPTPGPEPPNPVPPGGGLCGGGAAPCGAAGMISWMIMIAGLVAMKRR